MNIRPVKTDQDYNNTLERIEALWGAEPETPEGNELDILITLVKAYEDENHPVPPPSPIEAIKFVMDQRGFKQADLIPFIGSRPRVSEVLNGKRKLTLSMIRSLHSRLGIPAEVLIQDGSRFPADGEDVEWDSFPIKEIARRGWVSGFDPRTQAEEIMRSLAMKAGVQNYFAQAATAFLRQSSRCNEKDNPFAIQAWILGILSEARKIESMIRLSKDDLKTNLISRVVHLSVLKDGPIKAKEYLESRGVILVVIPHFPKTYVDGAALINDNGTPIIGLSLRYDRLDNFWFTLAHELSHLILGHVHRVEGHCIIDDLDIIDSLDKLEKEADNVAKDALIPSQLWSNHPAQLTGRIEDVNDLAKHLDINPAIVAGRIRFEKNNYRILSRQVGHREVKRHFV
jgi:HTH-type transcriptional regulator/antitoxin HigA